MDDKINRKQLLHKITWCWSIVTVMFLLLSIYVYFRGITGMPILFWGEKALPKEVMSYREGNLYIAELSDNRLSSHLRPSPARLLEDGKRLAPANAARSEIRSKGKGRYTFLDDRLYFSTSDNSDPITNGKVYAIRYPLILWEEAVYVVTSFLVIGIILAALVKIGPSSSDGKQDA